MKARKLLWPAAIIYDIITGTRNALFDVGLLKQVVFEVPVISVGNLTMGGTGKTPHVEYLIQLLKDNYKVATLSRGYGRNTKGFREVALHSTAIEIGDEPLQYKKKFPGISVNVCESRRVGIQAILKNYPDVIILDDAYQHRYVHPKVNILLTEFENPFFNDAIVPAGNLRESATGKNRADLIVVTKCPGHLSEEVKIKFSRKIKIQSHQQLFFTTLVYDVILPTNGAAAIQFSEYKNYQVLLLTGIANPKPLKSYLTLYFASVTQISFPDHHQFTQKDIMVVHQKFNKIAAPAIIITTDKDFMRLQDQLSGLPLYILPAEVSFTENKVKFDQYIINHVRKN